jgi:hypothetical protein
MAGNDCSFDINISQVNCQTRREVASNMSIPYINVQPSFQREYEAWDDRMKTRLIESILSGRRMNPIWLILNNDLDDMGNVVYDVLDGMHRIRTILGFVDGEYPLIGKYFSNEELGQKYNNVYFTDMVIDDKQIVRNYKMTFNCLDSSFHTNSTKRRDMYEILNKSTKTLNDYEFDKVSYNKFYDFLKKFKDNFKVWIYSKKDTRGAIEMDMMECLALSENVSSSWSSVNELRKSWQIKNLGESEESANDYLAKNSEKLTEKLNFIIKVAERLYEHKMIPENRKEYKSNALCLKFFISRIPLHIKNISLFNRHMKDIFSDFKSEVLEVDIQSKLEAKSRNAVFQKNLINLIDEIICRNVSNESRYFSKTDINRKLKEQDGKCAKCGCIPNHPEGHHKIEWSKGGKTEYENLEVLCDLCHKDVTRDYLKSASAV